MSEEARPSSVKENRSVRNACAVLEVIAREQPIGVSELARRTGIDKSAAHRIAVTLRSAGWLTAVDGGRWRIAPSVASLLRHAGTESLVETVRPTLERLRDQTAETAMLVSVEHGRLLVHDVADSPHALRITAPVGSELPIRNSSALRAIAAHTDAVELATLQRLDPGLDEDTLTETRTRGWAINDREITPDTRVVGAAVLDRSGRPLAAIIVCAPATRADLATMHAIGARIAAACRSILDGADAGADRSAR
ncbi:MAG: helix-turn-helix domain-containing protein [Acidimicrobiales bacterium]|jgi:DNA-binding IclR family transcriptional regulator|nr:helix-turn-helix domain-containing protein [Acidimicrobiales bacterium]